MPEITSSEATTAAASARLPARETPREYVASLTAAADLTADEALLSRPRAEDAASLVRKEAGRLALAYEKSTYAPESTEAAVSRFEEGHDWSALWSALRRLWMTRWGKRNRAAGS